MKRTQLFAMMLALVLVAVACGSTATDTSDTTGTTEGPGSTAAVTDDTEPAPVEETPDVDESAMPEGMTIAFSHPAAQAGVVGKIVEFASAEADAGGNTLLVGNFENGTPDEQFNQVETWITQGVDAIHVFPLDPNSLAPLQERAQEAGIIWVTYLLEMPGSDGFLTVDPVKSGTALGQAANDYISANGIEGTGLVLEFSVLPTLADRVGLAADAIEADGIEIVSRQDVLDTAGALTVTENTLTANPDLRVVVVITDDAAVGSALAMQNAGIDPDTCFVGGVDGTLEALQLLKAGETCYKASAAVDIRSFGSEVVNVPLRAIGGLEGTRIEFEPTVITVDDTELLDQYLAAYG